MFGRLYRHVGSENRFLFVCDGHEFPFADYIQRYWKLVAEGVDGSSLDITERALDRGRFFEFWRATDDPEASSS